MKRFTSFFFSGLALAGGTTIPTACHETAHNTTSESHTQGEHASGGKTMEEDEENEEDEQDEKDEHKEQSHEETIELAAAPEAVRAAAAKLASSGDIKKVERATEHGATSYEIGYMSAGKKCSATMTDRGEIMEIEKQGDLPDAARRAILKQMEGAQIVTAEAVQSSFFEVVVEKNGKKSAVKVFANGMIEGKPSSHVEQD